MTSSNSRDLFAVKSAILPSKEELHVLLDNVTTVPMIDRVGGSSVPLNMVYTNACVCYSMKYQVPCTTGYL